MTKNWAITIGVNQYDFLQPLKYAKRDAQLMQEFLLTEAGFERVFLFADDSPDVSGKSTRPYRANLLRVLRQLFEQPFMGVGDNFWFFFSGHGMRHAGRDYLMPSDGDPGDIENTAISINHVTERLRSCGADNVVLILDACRAQGTKTGEGIGQQTAERARQTGVISIFSCSPNEYSFEVEELQQGAFTCALLEGLGIRGQCATVERLNQYLTFRVPELVRQHRNARQTPYTIAEPVTKSHLILLPKYATQAEIATLKNEAYRAVFEEDLDLGEQLWIRVLAAASGQDMEAVKALQKIERLRVVRSEKKVEFSSAEPVSGGKSPTPEPGLLVSETKVEPDSAESAVSKESTTPDGNQSDEVRPTEPGQDDLRSERGVEYIQLRDLLSAGQWEAADKETAALMLEVSGRGKEDWLDSKDIKNFPTQDLRTIDQLWMKYSNGQFGFSVQKRIWQEEDENYQALAERVGWSVTNWVDYSRIIFSLEAPVGHLPVLGVVGGICGGGVELLSRNDLGSVILSDDLSSERGVDYRPLRDLLSAGKWKEADEETTGVMLKSADREKVGWLDTESIENFPCQDLCTINTLWVKYSKGRFGFSVQKRIWQEVNPNYHAFGNRVGWCVKDTWVYYSSLTFSLDAPLGHLPAVIVKTWEKSKGFAASSLIARLVSCNIQ